MRIEDAGFQARCFSTPPPRWKSRNAGVAYSPRRTAVSERKKTKTQLRSPLREKDDLFHVIHKVPVGDSPYVKAKQVQLIEKDPNRAISLFWAAINSGDRVDSALKDMAVVMKQLDRSDEAIEAIKSFRGLCPVESQESLDNVLVELYKRSGRLQEQIDLLEFKLKCIDDGLAFGGRKTKTARSQGKKIQITIDQERSRLLGNLAWAYLQQNNFSTAEELYRDALALEPDMNKECNLAICWMHMNRLSEAKSLLGSIKGLSGDGVMDESYAKSFERASEALSEVESQGVLSPSGAQQRNSREVVSSCFAVATSTNKALKSCVSPVKSVPVSVPLASRILVEGAHEEETLLLNQKHRGPCRNQLPSRDKDTRLGHDHQGSPYAFPIHIKGPQKMLLTERRKSSWIPDHNKHQGGGSYRDVVVGSASRKLSFDQFTRKNPEMAILKSRGAWVATVPISQRPNIDGNWRRDAKVKNEAATETISQLRVNGKSESSPSGSQSLHRPENNNLAANLQMQSPTTERSYHMPVSGSEKTTEMHGSTTQKNKKSWADMVEEDEQEEQLGGSRWDYTSHDPFSFSDWDIKGGLHKENLNYNIVYQTPPTSGTEITNLSENLKSLDLRDGTGTPTTSRNSSTARRSLDFSEQEKALTFDGFNCGVEIEREFTSDGVNSNSMNSSSRRNRLQVFKDITLLPDSPRA